MNLEFIKPQNLGSLLMKSSQSNLNLRSPSSYSVRSYLITTVKIKSYGPSCFTSKNSKWKQKNFVKSSVKKGVVFTIEMFFLFPEIVCTNEVQS